MKFHAIIVALSLALTFSAHAAESLCQQKANAIRHEIELAKKHNNQRRVNGLESALAEAKSGCSDDKLRAARQEKIAARHDKVKEREQELAKERNDGDKREKIGKRERKLSEAQNKLKKSESAPW